MLKADAKERLNRLGFGEFMCVVYLYCAYADGEFTEKEMQFARSPVDQNTFDQLHEAMSELSDQERLGVIMHHKKYYRTEESKKILLGEMQKMFEADDNFVPIERAVHRILGRLL